MLLTIISKAKMFYCEEFVLVVAYALFESFNRAEIEISAISAMEQEAP